MIQATATAELRWASRIGGGGILTKVLQRRFSAVENAGGHNERSYYLWLDVPTVTETHEDIAARVRAEEAMTAGQLTLQWPAPKLFG